MSERIAAIKRDTKETQIELSLNLDGVGTADISSGIGFYDHMLGHIALHGKFDLSIKASGRFAYRRAPLHRGHRHLSGQSHRRSARLPQPASSAWARRTYRWTKRWRG